MFEREPFGRDVSDARPKDNGKPRTYEDYRWLHIETGQPQAALHPACDPREWKRQVRETTITRTVGEWRDVDKPALPALHTWRRATRRRSKPLRMIKVRRIAGDRERPVGVAAAR